MRKHVIFRILLRASLGAIAIAVLAAYAVPPAQAVQGLLYQDTFTAPNDSHINDSLGLGRQGGTLIDYSGGIDYTQSTWWGGDSLLYDTGYLYQWDGTMVSPNKNFNGYLAQGGLTVEFGMNVYQNTYNAVDGTGTNQWGCFQVGAQNVAFWNPGSIAAILAYKPAIPQTEFGIYNNGGLTQTLVVSPTIDLSDQAFHDYKVTFTDTTDGNAFNGVGQTEINYYIKDALNAWVQIGTTETIGGGGMTDAHFTFNSIGEVTTWRNLNITGNLPNSWTNANGGSWQEDTNWVGGAPDGQGTAALFGGIGSIYTPIPVTVDADVTVGNIYFNNTSVSYDIEPGSGITPTPTIYLDNTGVSANALIEVDSGAHTIGVPMVQAGGLDILVRPNGSLTLTSSVDGGGNGGWNVNDAYNNGAVIVLGNVTGITGVNIAQGVVQVGASVGSSASIITNTIAGNGMLFLYGGSVAPPSGNLTVDVDRILMANGSTLTVKAGDMVSAADVVGVGVGDTGFVFDGGTFKCRPTSGAAWCSLLGGDNVYGTPLTTFAVTENGGTIDTNLTSLAVTQPFNNAIDVVTAGKMTVTGGGSLYMPGPGTFNGDWDITGSATTVFCGTANNFGPGNIDVVDRGTIAFLGGGAHANNIQLHGASDVPFYAAIQCDYRAAGGVDLQGNITVTDGTLYPGNDWANFTDFATHQYNAGGNILQISGPIDGTGGVIYGRAVGRPGGEQGGVIRIAGTSPNTYDGVTIVCNQFVELAKTGGGAIPHALWIDPTCGYQSSGIVLGADDQTSTDNVVFMGSFNYPAVAIWAEIALNGHSTTVRGLNTPVKDGVTILNDGLNLIENGANLSMVIDAAAQPYAPTANVGTLTVSPQSEEVYTFNGCIVDNYFVWALGAPIPGLSAPLALVKDGPGTQVLAPSDVGWYNGQQYGFTGGTTVKAGVLDISGVNAVFNDQQPELGFQFDYTQNSTITLEGGTLKASGLLQNTITRGAETSGTLEAGGAAYMVLEVNKAVDIGSALIDPGHTLSLTSGGENTIDEISGSEGTLIVTGTTVLNSNSIVVGTLQIGGVAPVAYTTISVPPAAAPVTPVPEPSTLLLLAIGGIMVALRIRKR